MRTDENVARRSFRFSDAWRRDASTGRITPAIDQRLAGVESTEGGKTIVHSLSGSERNRLFLNLGGTQFADLSRVSGLDTPADSRGWAMLDYDRDGWLDVAVVNANEPLFNLFHNDIAAVAPVAGEPENGPPNPPGQRGVVAIQFTGGAGGDGASPGGDAGWSNRGGIGAVVEVEAGGRLLLRELRCGEGFASQNSATLLVGLGAHAGADSIAVTWPSGRTTRTGAVPSGTLVQAFENPAESPGGDGFVLKPYLSTAPRGPAPDLVPTQPGDIFPVAARSPAEQPAAELRVFTTMATWCPSCRAHLPDVAALRAGLASDESVDLVGVPVDPEDTAAALAEYADAHRPAYRLLGGLPAAERAAASLWLARAVGEEEAPLPTTVITDAGGATLAVVPGLPTLSDLRRHLASLQAGHPGSADARGRQAAAGPATGR